MLIAIESSGMKLTADSVKAKVVQFVWPSRNNSTAFFVNKNVSENIKGYSKGSLCYTCKNIAINLQIVNQNRRRKMRMILHKYQITRPVPLCL